jgi:serine/threonine-protein kinase
LSAVWVLRRQLGLASPGEAGEKARAAALKAVQLDETLAEAHLRLAEVFTWTDFNFSEGEREYKRTLELDPNDSQARVLYGHLLAILGRPGEAIQQVDRAVAIDPLDVVVRVQCAFVLNYAQRYDEALAQAKQALRLRPGLPYAAAALIYAGHSQRRYADAASAATNFYEWRGRPDVAAAFKKAYAESGHAAAWRQATDVLLAKYGAEPGVAYDAAENCAIAGDRERAIGLLERAYAEGEPNLVYLRVNPLFEPLRAEPRFQALLKAMGLPQ